MAFIPGVLPIGGERLISTSKTGSSASDFEKTVLRLTPAQGATDLMNSDFHGLFNNGMPPTGGSINLGPQAVGGVSDAGLLFRPLVDFVGQVNALASEAGALQESFAAGESVDLHDVMIAAEKAGIGVKLVTVLRNKLLDAYQEISRMQV